MNPYETDKLVNEYLLFHYGADAVQMPWAFGPSEALHYPLRCVEELLDAASLPANARALDIGCAVGASSFALARYCTSVLGVDFSAAFISAARELAEKGEKPFEYVEVGTIRQAALAKVPGDVDRSRVSFEVGDACNLRAGIGCFDVVLAANLLCRLPRPRQFLARLPELIEPGGQLLMTTPNTWLEEYTAPEEWIGATPQAGQPFDVLQAILDPHFELIKQQDMPFLIREHARKFQWSVALGSVWRRR